MRADEIFQRSQLWNQIGVQILFKVAVQALFVTTFLFTHFANLELHTKQWYSSHWFRVDMTKWLWYQTSVCSNHCYCAFISIVANATTLGKNSQLGDVQNVLMLSLPGAPGCYCFLCPHLILSRSQIYQFWRNESILLRTLLWLWKIKPNFRFCHFSENRLPAALLGNLEYYLIVKCQFCNEILARGMQEIFKLDIYRNPITYMRIMHLHCVKSVRPAISVNRFHGH